METLSFHFLNVKDGDCSIIKHGSGHISIIDVCNARKEKKEIEFLESYLLENKYKSLGNFQQKKHPVNPIEYLKNFNESSVFRFILTHPDMDHMDGIKNFFEDFSPTNFYDTDNNEEKTFEKGSPYREEDWLFYKNLRDTDPSTNPKRLTVYSGDSAAYRTENWDGETPGDAFYVLSPTLDLVKESNETGNYNDLSYVILYRSSGGKILMSGDSGDKTWEHLLETHKSKIENIDLLIAPHHGRKSLKSYEFLDVLKPKLTFFGNARSEHLAYHHWSNRELSYITNNQANCMIVDCSGDNLVLYVTHEPFAKKLNNNTFYSENYKGYYIGPIS
jgi:competence protein ComEC